MAKGSGMIKPDMATMLAFVACNAKVASHVMPVLTKQLADQSFNRISVDGDTSTNDCFMLAATCSQICSASRNPGSPVAALALPLFITQARLSFARALANSTGGAVKADWVYTPATRVCVSITATTRSSRSLSPVAAVPNSIPGTARASEGC